MALKKQIITPSGVTCPGAYLKIGYLTVNNNNKESYVSVDVYASQESRTAEPVWSNAYTGIVSAMTMEGVYNALKEIGRNAQEGSIEELLLKNTTDV